MLSITLSPEICSFTWQVSSIGFNNGRDFVERMFLNLCFMCHFVVYSDFGKYLRAKSAANPGQVAKNPF